MGRQCGQRRVPLNVRRYSDGWLIDMWCWFFYALCFGSTFAHVCIPTHRDTHAHAVCNCMFAYVRTSMRTCVRNRLFGCEHLPDDSIQFVTNLASPIISVAHVCMAWYGNICFSPSIYLIVKRFVALQHRSLRTGLLNISIALQAGPPWFAEFLNLVGGSTWQAGKKCRNLECFGCRFRCSVVQRDFTAHFTRDRSVFQGGSLGPPTIIGRNCWPSLDHRRLGGVIRLHPTRHDDKQPWFCVDLPVMIKLLHVISTEVLTKMWDDS